jgi:hypothetical protein
VTSKARLSETGTTPQTSVNASSQPLFAKYGELKGTAIFECEGKLAQLGPGSFNYMPAKMVHEAWLPAGSLTFITVDGAWDINWVSGPPTAADVSK